MKQILRYGFCFTIILSILTFVTPTIFAAEGQAKENNLIILCYHNVAKDVHGDDYGVDRESFVNTIEYLCQHGFSFVSLGDIIAAHDGEKKLPPKPVLLTFDDAYVSFYEFVFPLLKEYNIPCVLGVVSSWVDKRPTYVEHPIMTWKMLKEVAKSPLVEIATHTHHLHHGVIYNPQGNEAPAGNSRMYDPKRQTYEDEKSYRKRIREDLKKAKAVLKEKLGVSVRAVVWPYGEYNHMMIEEATKVGLIACFPLNDKRANAEKLTELNRFMVYKNPTLKDLLKDIGVLPSSPEQTRIIQIDLDAIYNKDPAQTEKNLGELLDRIKEIKPSIVYLQAFADPEGTGNIKEVYFPNRVLPMRADLFSRVVHQLKTRTDVLVYAWMPMLSIVLPDKEENQALRVRSYKNGKIAISSSWYERLSPFSQKTIKKLKMLYEDMAIHSWIDGVVFQDDGYLNDFEDFHPEAIKVYQKITGGKLIAPYDLSYKQLQEWTKRKTDQLITLTTVLKKIVSYYRPEAVFGRILYAPVLDDPDSEEWLAQNFSKSLKAYDFVVVMAYPRMEDVKSPKRWLRGLVKKASRYPKGLEKTVFKVQAYNWKKDKWIPAKMLRKWLRWLVSAGARHIGYYPDDYVENHPDKDIIRWMISTEDFPFPRTRAPAQKFYH